VILTQERNDVNDNDERYRPIIFMSSWGAVRPGRAYHPLLLLKSWAQRSCAVGIDTLRCGAYNTPVTKRRSDSEEPIHRAKP
jgi:hypothetical protein